MLFFKCPRMFSFSKWLRSSSWHYTDLLWLQMEPAFPVPGQISLISNDGLQNTKQNPQNLSVSMWGLWRGVKLDEVFSHTNKYTLWTELTDPTARGDEVASFRGIRVREPQKGGGTGDTSFKTHQSLKWCVPMIINGRMQSFLSFSHTHQHTFSVPFPLSLSFTHNHTKHDSTTTLCLFPHAVIIEFTGQLMKYKVLFFCLFKGHKYGFGSRMLRRLQMLSLFHLTFLVQTFFYLTWTVESKQVIILFEFSDTFKPACSVGLPLKISF